jgi:hypothetical protein
MEDREAHEKDLYQRHFARPTLRLDPAAAAANKSRKSARDNGSAGILSGCHCTPTIQFESPFHSTASTTPSGAREVIRKPEPGSSTD